MDDIKIGNFYIDNYYHVEGKKKIRIIEITKIHHNPLGITFKDVKNKRYCHYSDSAFKAYLKMKLLVQIKTPELASILYE